MEHITEDDFKGNNENGNHSSFDTEAEGIEPGPEYSEEEYGSTGASRWYNIQEEEEKELTELSDGAKWSTYDNRSTESPVVTMETNNGSGPINSESANIIAAQQESNKQTVDKTTNWGDSRVIDSEYKTNDPQEKNKYGSETGNSDGIADCEIKYCNAGFNSENTNFERKFVKRETTNDRMDGENRTACDILVIVKNAEKRVLKKKLRKKKLRKNVSGEDVMSEHKPFDLNSEDLNEVRKLKKKKKPRRKKHTDDCCSKNKVLNGFENNEPLDVRNCNSLWMGTHFSGPNHIYDGKNVGTVSQKKDTKSNLDPTCQSLSYTHLFTCPSVQCELPNTSFPPDDTCSSKPVETGDRRLLRKKRAFLKKTSAKIAILPSAPSHPLISSRLDVKTARSYVHVEFSPEPEVETPEPLKICKLITRFPMLCFSVLTLIHLAVIGVTLGLLFTGSDVFPAVFDTLPLYIYNDARLKELSWRSKTNYPGYIYRPVYGYAFNSGYRGRVKDVFEIIFEKPGRNILDKRHLSLIKSAEDEIFNDNKYQEHFCLLDRYYTCIQPQSILRLFDGTYSHVDAIFNDPHFDNVTGVIYKASIHNETREFLELFIGKDSIINPRKCFTSITRTMLLIGWPLYPINGRLGTVTSIQEFLADTIRPKVEHIRDFDLIEILDVYYVSKLLYEYDLVKQALVDIKLAIGSFLFIFVFMSCQTGSVIVTFLGILSILSSFLLTNLFYRYALQFKYFGFFHVIAIFLILGIGADDLFVFYDTWRLTGHNTYPSDAHRMSDCYRKAAKTTFVTSVTTMVAFLVSGLSPLLPVRTFGLFSGLLILLNYIWVIVYFPSIIMLHHTKTKFAWKAFRRLLFSVCFDRDPKVMAEKCRRQSVSSATCSENKAVSEVGSSRKLLTDSAKQKTEGPEKNPPGSDNHSYSVANQSICTISQGFDPLSNQPRDGGCELQIEIDGGCDADDMKFHHHVPMNLDLQKIECDTQRAEFLERLKRKPKKNFEDRNIVVKFLKNGFFDLMTKRVVKFVVPLLFLGVSIFFIHRATLIEPDTQQLRLFRSNHNYAKATERHYASFMRNQEDEYQRVYLVWGLKPADISGCDQKSGDYCFGSPQYDNRFDMNSADAQLAFKDLCKRLENMDHKQAASLKIRRNAAGGLKIQCFIRDFEDFFENHQDKNYYPADTHLTLPVTSGNVTRLMKKYPYVYQYSSQLPADFDRYFEMMVSFWLTNEYSLYPTQSYVRNNELFGEQSIPGTTQYAYYDRSGLYYGTKLKYMAVEINTTMNVFNLGYVEGLPVYDEWEKLIQDINEIMPPPLKNGIQVGQTLWHWLFVQKTLADSAITGIVVGLLSAWPILVLTTLNFVIGTIAAISIGLVTACVVGIIPLAGWKLGVLESINLCMVVGLSVDYIVHLAEAYRSSPSTGRTDRVHHMLESIGLSVVSGAVTTIGAAVFMLFAKIQFFFQFGIFIISTVGISLLFALFGFTTFLSLCGPQGETGCLKAFVRGCKKFCLKRDNSDTEDSKEKQSCVSWPCVSPSMLLERCYDWLSYGDIE